MTESFEEVDQVEGTLDAGTPFAFLHLLVGSVVAVSLARSVFRVWKIGAPKSLRLLLSEHLYSTALKSTPYQQVRKVFLDAPSFRKKPAANHSHPEAANHRTTAVRFFNHVTTFLGLDAYCYQMSSRDQSQHVRGERTYYWARDANVMPWLDEIKDTDAVSMVDVDYYVDMPTHLADHPQIHMLYTFMPDYAGRATPEYSYFFNGDSELVLNVAGGAKYVHRLWNWSTDWFTVSKFNRFGIPTTTVLYDCTVRRVCDDKAAVLLVPCKHWTGLSAILGWMIGRPLERLTTAVGGGFTKIRRYVNGSTVHVSVARQCTETSATVSLDVFNRLKAIQSVSPSNKLLMYQVKQLTPNKDDAAIITDYFWHATDGQVPDLHCVPEPQMIEFSVGNPMPEDKPSMVAFMRPLVPPAFVPTNNPPTANQAIEGRVKVPAATVKKLLGDFKMTNHKVEVVRAFWTLVFPKVGCLTPLTHDEVVARQHKPAQVKEMQEAGFINTFSGFVQSFMKKEAYGKPTDPRNITTYPAKVKADYAAFMYALADELAKLDCYAFKKTPKQVAEHVARIASKAKHRINCPDLHRMDGHVNEFTRIFERAGGLRAFGPAYAEEFARCHDEAFGNIGITSDGTRYDQGFSRGSGSHETSVFNTLFNLFIIFYAYVLSGCSYEEAFKHTQEDVMAGGDDGLVADLAPAFLIKAAQLCGMVLTCDTFVRGQPGVNFLARVYGPDVWEGSPNSMCQIKRTLEKIHLTPAVPLNDVQKMYEKAVSYSLTDSNTPIVGDFCAAVKRVCKGFTTTNTLSRYGDHHSPSDQYPNVAEDWMMEFVENELTLVDAGGLIAYLRDVTEVRQLLTIPRFFESGREFTYDDWDPTPGRLIKQTVDELSVRVKPEPKRSRTEMSAAVAAGAALVVESTDGSASRAEGPAPSGADEVKVAT
jgi:hypothetical protein